MRGIDPDISAGSYARKQVFSASRLIAWTHRRRLATALRLCRRIGAERVLDYGCGDGTFLALLTRGARAPVRAVGADIAKDLVADCRRRLERAPRLTFVHTDALEGPEHLGRYDLVVCMEVLEHVVEINATIDRLVGWMTQGGLLLVSVPVETGAAVLLKQSMRRLAGWLRIADYPGTASYSWRELLASVHAGDGQHIPRPVYRGPDGRPFHDHKGFNWRVLRRVLSRRLNIKDMQTSPIPYVPPALASQVWFLARRRRR